MHDGSTERSELCAACEDPYLAVYMLPDEVWDQIAAGANQLCMHCADRRARKLGIELYWEAEVGEFPRDFRRRVEKAVAEHRPVLERLANDDAWRTETHGAANDVTTTVIPHQQP